MMRLRCQSYKEVTYYRSKTRQYYGGTSETKWSTCDPVDNVLIEDGFKLTGNKKKHSVNNKSVKKHLLASFCLTTLY